MITIYEINDDEPGFATFLIVHPIGYSYEHHQAFKIGSQWADDQVTDGLLDELSEMFPGEEVKFASLTGKDSYYAMKRGESFL